MKRNLVEPRAMDDQGTTIPERAKCLGDRSKQFFVSDAEELDARPRRIQAGPKQVHDGPNLERAPDGTRMRDPRVVERRE